MVAPVCAAQTRSHPKCDALLLCNGAFMPSLCLENIFNHIRRGWTPDNLTKIHVGLFMNESAVRALSALLPASHAPWSASFALFWIVFLAHVRSNCRTFVIDLDPYLSDILCFRRINGKNMLQIQQKNVVIHLPGHPGEDDLPFLVKNANLGIVIKNAAIQQFLYLICSFLNHLPLRCLAPFYS